MILVDHHAQAVAQPMHGVLDAEWGEWNRWHALALVWIRPPGTLPRGRGI